MIEFQAWPKIARLNRDIVITEKIDGTNAAVIIEDVTDVPVGGNNGVIIQKTEDQRLFVAAQSRKRLITPQDDNFGFAKWVYANATALADVLGPGRHFGEWWGSGIQRGYGLPKGEKRFSLFNTKRYAPLLAAESIFEPRCLLPELDTTPILYDGPFSDYEIEGALTLLRNHGSVAQPGFDRPEGIVVYHTAANQMFKVTLENDAAPKSTVQNVTVEEEAA